MSFAEGFLAAATEAPEAPEAPPEEAEDAATNAGFKRVLKSFARALAVSPDSNAVEKEAQLDERVSGGAAAVESGEEEEEEAEAEGTRHTSVEKPEGFAADLDLELDLVKPSRERCD